MAAAIQPVQSEILELIGAIVLSTQDAEKYMKVVLPFTDSKDPSFSGALLRHDKLKKRTFGELTAKFVDSSTSDSNDFARHLAALVDQRNQIVHHFSETYGQKLGPGNSQNVVAALRAQLNNVNAFRDALAGITLQLFEAMRDTTFQGTPEHQEIGELCAAFRQHLAS